MRNALLLSTILLGFGVAPAFAASDALSNPSSPSSSQAMPQPKGSVPSDGAISQPSSAGTTVNNGGTSNTLAEHSNGTAYSAPASNPCCFIRRATNPPERHIEKAQLFHFG